MISKKQSLTATQEAEAWGIDVSLLDANLERSPEKRLILHQRSLTTAQLLQKAVRHARSKRNSETHSGK